MLTSKAPCEGISSLEAPTSGCEWEWVALAGVVMLSAERCGGAYSENGMNRLNWHHFWIDIQVHCSE